MTTRAPVRTSLHEPFFFRGLRAVIWRGVARFFTTPACTRFSRKVLRMLRSCCALASLKRTECLRERRPLIGEPHRRSVSVVVLWRARRWAALTDAPPSTKAVTEDGADP